MAQARAKAQPRSFKKKISLRDFFNTPKRKKIALGALLLVAAIGAYFVFFVGAAPNNCQIENNVEICDVDMVASGGDTILDTRDGAKLRGDQGWGIYYGATFRAPRSEYNGSVPVYQVDREANTWHEYVTTEQKAQKEAKYGALTRNDGVAFFAWTDARQPGTVPVYRLTRSGPYTQSIFSTDKAWVDSMIAQNANNPDGWKADAIMPLIAFYAYPPNYAVAATPNPYDCSILENLNSGRCPDQKKNLETIAASGAYTADTCPQNLKDWLSAPFKSKFDAECQKKWNDYSQRCDIPENFETDRCKGPREALAKAQAEQAKKRADEEAARRKAAKDSGSGAKSGDNGADIPDSPSIAWCTASNMERAQSVKPDAYNVCVMRWKALDCAQDATKAGCANDPCRDRVGARPSYCDPSSNSSGGNEPTSSQTIGGMSCIITYQQQAGWGKAAKSYTYSKNGRISLEAAREWCKSKYSEYKAWQFGIAKSGQFDRVPAGAAYRKYPYANCTRDLVTWFGSWSPCTVHEVKATLTGTREDYTRYSSVVARN